MLREDSVGWCLKRSEVDYLMRLGEFFYDIVLRFYQIN